MVCHKRKKHPALLLNKCLLDRIQYAFTNKDHFQGEGPIYSKFQSKNFSYQIICKVKNDLTKIL